MLNYQQVDFKNIVIIIAIWLTIVILINPIGNFPLNDDWAYGWSVKILLEKGNFQLSDWTATNLLSQVVWGTLFCLPFGFSFTALRFSVLILGLVGVIATYGLLREAKASPKLSLFSSLVVALNPIYFVLSNSFSTDIPSFTFFVLSCYFLVRGIRLDSKNYIFAGLIFAFISILNRQSSLIILPAFGIAYLVHQGFTFRTFIKAFSPTLLGIFIYSGYSYWLEIAGKTPLLYGFQIEKLKESLSNGNRAIAFTYIENIWILCIYLGLFLFPFLVLQFSQLFKTFSPQQKRMSVCLTLFLVAIGVVLILKGEQMPLIGNTLENMGLGPVSLEGYNSFLSENRYLSLLNRSYWAILTLIGLIGASILIQYFFLPCKAFINHINKLSQLWLIVFLISASFLYLLPIAGISKGYWFDRYLILLLPLLMVSIVILTGQFSNESKLRPKVIFLFCAMLLCLGVFTISATHDYLSRNRVRWQALNYLTKSSMVLPEQIYGGFEFNGWYFGHRIKTCNPEFWQSTKNNVNISVGWEDFFCLWDDSNREYMVSFIPKAGYEEQAAYSFRRWLPWREETLYVLHKND